MHTYESSSIVKSYKPRFHTAKCWIFLLGKFCWRTPQKHVIGRHAPQRREFAQYHYKFVVVCRNTPCLLFYSFLRFKREKVALPETETLPSAKFFAECQKSGTRQLPSAALGKDFFAECRALGKHGHSAKDFFAECQTLGKISILGIGCP